MGGAVLTEVPEDDEASSMQFAGSTLVVTASSREEIIEMLKKDVYAESGVWDVEKVSLFSVSAKPLPRSFVPFVSGGGRRVAERYCGKGLAPVVASERLTCGCHCRVKSGRSSALSGSHCNWAHALFGWQG